jgi:hypothetical protein
MADPDILAGIVLSTLLVPRAWRTRSWQACQAPDELTDVRGKRRQELKPYEQFGQKRGGGLTTPP